MAAGQGKRMHSARPKVLHPLAGRPLVAHVLDSARALAPRRDALSTFDRLTLDLNLAICRGDWEGGFRLARERAATR